jgi:hypothetical protein
MRGVRGRPISRSVVLIAGPMLAASVAAGAEAPTPAPTPAAPKVVEIDAGAIVAVAPRLAAQKANRILEIEVEIASYLLAPEQPKNADRSAVVDMTSRVRVVHDQKCGGEVSLLVGDKIEIRGEYVDNPDGADVIRFTHSGGAEGCGEKSHPAGFLRKFVPVTPTPKVKVIPPAPAGMVPDQPSAGAPSASARPWTEILRLKQEGATNEKLLEKIAAEKKTYSMSLADMQELRAAGVSAEVIQAMLQSGRAPLTPVPSPNPARTPPA